MTTTMKAKPLSQLRREEKARKALRKTQKMAKLQKEQSRQQQLKANVKKDYDEYLDSLKNIKPLQRTAKKKDLPIEEYFVKEVASLDVTLTDIVSSIQKMSHLRQTLNWDGIKEYFGKTDVENFEIKMAELLKLNEGFEKSIIEVVNKAVEQLESTKVEPTHDKVDTYVLGVSTEAFGIFASWNEVVIEKFHEVTDLIENFNSGEDK